MASRAPLAVLSLLALLAPPARSQDIQLTPDGDQYVLQFDEKEGEKLTDFIDLAKDILNRPIKYVPEEVGQTTIKIVGRQVVAREKFFQYFQAVLKAYDYIVYTYGPENANFLSVQKVTAQGRALTAKAAAPVVDVADLVKYRDDPGTLITTSIMLRYVDARSVMATFQQLVDPTIEAVRNVENANSLVITGFGQHVWGVWQLVQLVDVPPLQAQPVIVKRELHFASVDDLADVLTELLSAARGLRPGQQQAAAQQAVGMLTEIEPRVIAEPRSNSLLIAGSQDMVDRIEGWIDALDVEVDPRGNTHIYRLKNTNAEEVATVLNQVLQEEKTNLQQGRSAAAAAGGGAAGATDLEVTASAVADRTSNSIIITAGDRKFGALVEIIRELDVRRRQVLIEAAIVETSKTLNDILAVGVAVGDLDDGAFVSNFGTPLALPAADASGNIDISGSIANGANIALFSGGDLPIPLLLQALESDSENQVLSRPYLLTNDNEEAFFENETQTSFQTSTTTNSTTNITFDQVEARILLRVSPTISAGNYLRLAVNIEVSNFAAASSGLSGAPPDIISRIIETPVTLPDGHTVILGGLLTNSSNYTEGKIPWLGDIPGLGWLFRSSSDRSEDKFLYVFLTPHIIDTDFALLDEISDVKKRDYERLGGDVRDLGQELLDGSPDSRVLGRGIDAVFELPSASLPASGDRGVPASPPPASEPPALPPATPEGAPRFDEVFGFDAPESAPEG